jgi:hypothetical protein
MEKGKTEHGNRYESQTLLDHRKLGSSNFERISVDMTNLVHEQMATMKNELIQSAEARENQPISKLLLLKAMASDDSPYASHAQLQTVMASIDVIV